MEPKSHVSGAADGPARDKSGGISEIGFIRLTRVLDLIPLSKSQIWEMARRQEFPRPVKLSTRTSAWRVEDIKAWIESRNSACPS